VFGIFRAARVGLLALAMPVPRANLPLGRRAGLSYFGRVCTVLVGPPQFCHRKNWRPLLVFVVSIQFSHFSQWQTLAWQFARLPGGGASNVVGAHWIIRPCWGVRENACEKVLFHKFVLDFWQYTKSPQYCIRFWLKQTLAQVYVLPVRAIFYFLEWGAVPHIYTKPVVWKYDDAA